MPYMLMRAPPDWTSEVDETERRAEQTRDTPIVLAEIIYNGAETAFLGISQPFENAGYKLAELDHLHPQHGFQAAEVLSVPRVKRNAVGDCCGGDQ